MLRLKMENTSTTSRQQVKTGLAAVLTATDQVTPPGAAAAATPRVPVAGSALNTQIPVPVLAASDSDTAVDTKGWYIICRGCQQPFANRKILKEHSLTCCPAREQAVDKEDKEEKGMKTRGTVRKSILSQIIKGEDEGLNYRPSTLLTPRNVRKMRRLVKPEEEDDGGLANLKMLAAVAVESEPQPLLPVKKTRKPSEPDAPLYTKKVGINVYREHSYACINPWRAEHAEKRQQALAEKQRVLAAHNLEPCIQIKFQSSSLLKVRFDGDTASIEDLQDVKYVEVSPAQGVMVYKRSGVHVYPLGRGVFKLVRDADGDLYVREPITDGDATLSKALADDGPSSRRNISLDVMQLTADGNYVSRVLPVVSCYGNVLGGEEGVTTHGVTLGITHELEGGVTVPNKITLEPINVHLRPANDDPNAHAATMNAQASASGHPIPSHGMQEIAIVVQKPNQGQRRAGQVGQKAGATPRASGSGTKQPSNIIKQAVKITEQPTIVIHKPDQQSSVIIQDQPKYLQAPDVHDHQQFRVEQVNQRHQATSGPVSYGQGPIILIQQPTEVIHQDDNGMQQPADGAHQPQDYVMDQAASIQQHAADIQAANMMALQGNVILQAVDFHEEPVDIMEQLAADDDDDSGIPKNIRVILKPVKPTPPPPVVPQVVKSKESNDAKIVPVTIIRRPPPQPIKVIIQSPKTIDLSNKICDEAAKLREQLELNRANRVPVKITEFAPPGKGSKSVKVIQKVQESNRIPHKLLAKASMQKVGDCKQPAAKVRKMTTSQERTRKSSTKANPKPSGSRQKASPQLEKSQKPWHRVEGWKPYCASSTRDLAAVSSSARLGGIISELAKRQVGKRGTKRAKVPKDEPMF